MRMRKSCVRGAPAPPSLCTTKMGTNAGWPEAFGFSVCGGVPVVICQVEEGGSAQQAGLQPGDIITELDGQDVKQWNLGQVISGARESAKVPPSMVVISRVREFRLRPDKEGGYGITLRGNCPVFIRSVDFLSPARQAGIRSGDLLLEVNGTDVRHSSKLEVLELLRGSRDELSVVVVAGGLDWAPLPSSPPSTSALKKSQQLKISTKHKKAIDFHNKVRYYLLNDNVKKTHLWTLLRLYARDRNVDSLAGSLGVLLEGPIERRLIPAVRDFLQPRHRPRFDNILSYTPNTFPATPTRRSSVDTLAMPRPLASTRSAQWTSSLPTLTAKGGKERLVRIHRGNGGFGFSLSGNAPVFIRSVDAGGPAALAGLKPGDQLLGVNGLNIRNATHSHVVRLLRGSGTSPSLLVSSMERGRPSSSRYRGGVALEGTEPQTNAFQQKMAEVLLPQEKEKVIEQLTTYSRQRDISKLVEGLHTLLDDPTKMVLFHYVCQLLPEEAQAEFDHVAASRLADGNALEDTAIGSVGECEGFGNGGEDRGILDHLGEEGEGEEGGHMEVLGERMEPWQKEDLRVKRRSMETTPMGQSLAELLSKREATTPAKRCPTEVTPTATPTPTTPNVTSTSTPGVVPPPPPTPVVGPGGVPIPPPPPPSLPTSSQPHIKRVNWQKLHRTDGTVWGELSGLNEAIELADLDTQFAVRKSKESGGGKPKKPAILDSKKAYNISILLAHLKLPTQTIKHAVLSCDDTILGEQHLRQMEAFAPDKKECLGFARYYDNPSILSLPDQFSCEMSTIPCYQQRLHAMVFQMHYQEKVDEITPDLEAICQASVQLQKSKLFKKILELVLAIGNHMNMGNTRIGQAQGFRISFLSQLHGLRTTDGQSTLLHFLAALVERKFPQVLEFHEDLPTCKHAARVSGQTLEAEVNELSQGLRDIRKDISEISSRDKLPGDRFQEVMTTFLTEADGRMTELLRLYSRMKQEYKQVVHFFGEDPTKMRIDDFFGIFASFMTDFQRAVQDNKRARYEGEVRRRLEGGMARRQGQTSKPHPPGPADDQYLKFKEELENMHLRPVPEKPQSSMEQRPQQTDFTHLLRPRATPTTPRPSQFDEETHF